LETVGISNNQGRHTPIGNRKSAIGNGVAIGNRQSEMDRMLRIWLSLSRRKGQRQSISIWERTYLVKAFDRNTLKICLQGLGVDIEHDFKRTYEVIPDTRKRNNKKIVAELKKAAKEADAVYLAADPDREGEAICQHLAEEIVPKRPPNRRTE